jgi:3',5'-cyclic-AMP phosphodiesterase
MPGIFLKSCNRRTFLSASALGSVALGISGCRGPQGHVSAGKLHVALLSDTHIPGDRKNGSRGFNPWENLQMIVPEVVEVRPRAVLLNGDAARLEGTMDDYRELRLALEPIAAIAPIYIGLGNHDDRANFNKTFPSAQVLRANVADKHVLVLDEPFLRILLLDSLLYTNKTAGLLGRKQRLWLAEYLATTSDKPVVIFVHHTLGDEDGELLDARRLFDIVQPHKQVKAIFYGHSHVWEIKQRDGLHLVNLPAVGYNFRDNDPVGWVDAIFDSNGADLTLRALAGNRTGDRKVHRLNWG